MPGSVAPAVKAAVITGLRAHAATLDDLNGVTAAERHVEVTYSYDPASNATEQLYTGRTRAATPPAAMRAGRNHRNETGTFDLIVRVDYIGGDVETAEARAFAIGGVVEEWLADRKSNELGVTGLNSLVVEEWSADTGVGDARAGALIVYTVRWTARLT